VDASKAIIFISLIILFSYLTTIATSKIRIPSVFLLLLLGILLQFFAIGANIDIPNLKDLISILGTIGLILIVLEASLEIHVTRNNISRMFAALIAAVLIVSLTSTVLYFIMTHLFALTGEAIILGCIALSIVSSAIVIPSVALCNEKTKLFLTLESAFADVFGVILFNFFQTTEQTSITDVGIYFIEIGLMVLISLVAVVGLAAMLKLNQGKVRYFVILATLLLLYGLGKLYHLPVLVLVLLFGLVLSNFAAIKEKFTNRWLSTIDLQEETRQFEVMNNEVSFIVRTFFFIIFGFQLHIRVLGSWKMLLAGMALLVILYLVRLAVLFFFVQHNRLSTVLTAPRGLITILLFYQINFDVQELKLIDLMSVCVIGSILVMTLVISRARPNKEIA